MLFRSGATAVNAGKVYFTQNPLAINYPQWIAFAKYSYSQLKWILIDKPKLRNDYVLDKLNDELNAIIEENNATFNVFAEEYTVVFH